MEKEVCTRVFPDGVMRSGFINDEGTYCIIRVWNQDFKFPIIQKEEEKG